MQSNDTIKAARPDTFIFFSPHISHIPNYTLGYQKSEVCKVFCHNPWKNNFIRKGAEEAEPESGRNTTFGKRCISLIENRLENSSWTIPPPPLFFFFPPWCVWSNELSTEDKSKTKKPCCPEFPNVLHTWQPKVHAQWCLSSPTLRISWKHYFDLRLIDPSTLAKAVPHFLALPDRLQIFTTVISDQVPGY